MSNIIFSKHARDRLNKRKIPEGIVWKILSENNAYALEDGLTVYHGLISEQGRGYRIRIFMNKNVTPEFDCYCL